MRLTLFIPILLCGLADAQYSIGKVPVPTPLDPQERWADITSEKLLLTIGENLLNPDEEQELIWARPLSRARDHFGSGLFGYFHTSNPERPIAQQFAGSGALNFEHVISLLPSDNYRSAYTPRTEPCQLEILSDTSARLVWENPNAAWPFNVTVRYEILDDCVEVTLEVFVIESVQSPEIRFMFASYMFPEVDRLLRTGPDENDVFGTPKQFEDQGRNGWVVAGEKAPDIRWISGTNALNLERLSELTWKEPIWFGYVDGDRVAETNDPYLMSYSSNNENVEILMWRWLASTAWDWSWVIYSPNSGSTYTYKMLVCYEPAYMKENGELDHPENWLIARNNHDSWIPRTVKDDNAPVIRFKDKGLPDRLEEILELSIPQDSPFELSQFLDYVIDNEDGIIYANGQIHRGGEFLTVTDLDSSVVDSRSITLTARDVAGNQSVRELKVNVLPVMDTAPPTIQLLGNKNEEIVKGTSWTDLGVAAIDNRDANPSVHRRVISPSGKTLPSIGVNSIGRWTIEYWARDSSGNESEKEIRSVTVRDPNLRARFLDALRNFINQRMITPPHSR